MKLIKRDTDYAIRALTFICECKRYKVTVNDLVKELKIPMPFLRKICQLLNKKGVVRSYKGKGGGFTLATAPDKIFLTDIINIFQGPVRLNECLFKKKICPNKCICLLNKKIDSIEKYVVGELKAVTIASLVRKGG